MRPAPRTSTPLSRYSTRVARAAACGSCVTMTMVLPCSRLRRLQQVEDLVAGLAVEIAGRLVAEQQRRVGDDARGRCRRAAPGRPRAAADSASRDRSGRRPPAPSRRAACARPRDEAGQQQRQLDVALGRQHRQQVVELEDEPDVPGAPARPAGRPTSGRCAARRPRSRPRVGRSRPPSRFSSVDLPDPDGPISARKSPRGMSRFRPCSTSIRSPPRRKSLCTLRTVTRTPSAGASTAHARLPWLTGPRPCGRRPGPAALRRRPARPPRGRSTISTWSPSGVADPHGAALHADPRRRRTRRHWPWSVADRGLRARASSARGAATRRRLGRRPGTPPSRPCRAGSAGRASRTRCAPAPSPSGDPPSGTIVMTCAGNAPVGIRVERRFDLWPGVTRLM